MRSPAGARLNGPGTGPTAWVLATGRRLGWGLADQAMSSITNFALGLLVARTVGPREFGAFSLAFATYTLALAASRALATEPLMVRYSAASEARWRRGIASASGTALLIGTAAGLICAVASAALASGPLAVGLGALSVSLPGLLLQDSWRYGFFVGGKGGRAFANDLAWAVVLFPAVGILLRTGRASMVSLMLAWGGAASVAAFLGTLQSRTIPRPGRTVAWLRDQRDLAPRFLIETALGSGVGQITLYGVGLVAGLGAVGALRAGQLLIGPFNLLVFAMGLVAVPEGVRALGAAPPLLRRTAVFYSTVLAAGALVWGGVAFGLPADIGVNVLRSNWAGGRALVVPLTIAAAASGLSFGAGAGLRALATARRSLKVRMLDAGLTLAAGFGGAAIAGASGTAWLFAVAALALVPAWWSQFGRSLRERSAWQLEGRSRYPLVHPSNEREGSG